MSVWFAIPSVRPPAEADAVLSLWRAQGFRIAVLRQGEALPQCDIQIATAQYLGWAASVNLLVREILQADPDAEWVITGGDDYWPDATHTAAEIAAQCREHFGGTFGVMQPTGDRWGETPGGTATIERIAGSPWMGREWCERANQGQGPLWLEYHHNYADEELQLVAQREGRFWQRRDLVHLHMHWARPRGDVRDRPAFAEYINGREYYEAQATFRRRQAAGFPGSEPLEKRRG